MKIWKLLLAFACCAGLVWGQNRTAGNTLSQERARALQGLSESQIAEADAMKAAATTFNGTIKFVITTTIKSTIPTTDQIGCTAEASVADGTFPLGNSLDETAAVAATRSGSTAKCTVVIPYSWASHNIIDRYGFVERVRGRAHRVQLWQPHIAVSPLHSLAEPHKDSAQRRDYYVYYQHG